MRTKCFRVFNSFGWTMLHKLQMKTLGLAVAIALLLTGGKVSLIRDISSEHEALIALNASRTPETCQTTPGFANPCSKNDSHSATTGSSNHCQQHCSHSLTGMLTSANLISLDSTHTKVSLNSQLRPQSIALDPSSRPPNF